MTLLSRVAQQEFLTRFLAQHNIHLVVVNTTVAASLSETSTVTNVAAGEIANVPRVLVSSTSAPIAVAWNATTARAEATVTVQIENTGLTDATYGTFAFIYGGSITSGNTTGNYYGKRNPYSVGQVLPSESTQSVDVVLAMDSAAVV